MSVWDDLVGQEDAVEVLRRAALPGSGALAHAWLFTGPPGSGRSVAARAFAAALLCETGTGCGTCHACRTAVQGTHADLRVVATEQLTLRIDAVRELVQAAQRRPSTGRWRIVLVEDADRMLERTTNVLLKAVEEPPPRTVWLLCAPSPEDVLPTIRSRARPVRLRVPPVAAVAELLVRRDGVDPAMAAFAARAAQSHVGLARRLARDEGARTRRREVVRTPLELRGTADAVVRAGELVDVATEEAASATAERDARERADLLRTLGVEPGRAAPPALRSQVRQLEEDQKKRATRLRRDVLDRALLDLLSVYRDVLVLQLGADVELVNASMAGELETLARRGGPAATLGRMDAIGTARERIQANVSPLLAVEALCVSLLPEGADAA
ncbi:DNA polymerase III subunit delta' [uncultured Pseudokineococcus sp.]|uniref:DNA polymerase III subunit delta' n=1 Tax=uncultured Pseudokineococcus sp. TaxID=1642928 RepID=UPI00263183F3|nr:DNA polymerase III subunit delta' [uncultured Pseudokineococcus sp.]